MTTAAPPPPSDLPAGSDQKSQLEELYADVEQWVDQWDDAATRRYVGPDGLPRLLVHTPDGKFMFSPAGGPGADAIVDYYQIPSLDSVMLVLSEGVWTWHEPSPDPAVNAISRPWDEEGFRRATDGLKAAGAET